MSKEGDKGFVRHPDLTRVSRKLFKSEEDASHTEPASAEPAKTEDANEIAAVLRSQIATCERQILAFSTWIDENTKPHENLFEIDTRVRAQATTQLAKVEASLADLNLELDKSEKAVRAVLMEGVPQPDGLQGIEGFASERLITELKETLAFEPCKMTFVEHRKQADLLREATTKKRKEKKKTTLIQHHDPEVRRLCSVRQVSVRVLYGLARKFDLLQQENALQDHHFKEIDRKIHEAIGKALVLLKCEEEVLREIIADRQKWVAKFQRLQQQFAAVIQVCGDSEPETVEKATRMVCYSVTDYLDFEAKATADRRHFATLQHAHANALIEATLARVGLKKLAEWRSRELKAAGVEEEEARTDSSSSKQPPVSAG